MAKYVYGDRIAREGRVLLGCSAIVLDGERRKILLHKRTDNGLWSIPGGALDPGESVTESCVREVREETGLEVEVVRLVGVYSDPHRLLVYPDGNRFHLVSIAFEARVLVGTLTTNEESSDFLWADVTELEGIDLVEPQLERIRDALSGRTFVR